MIKVASFSPIANSDATVLILGSMPGVRSLEANRYYAHPHNCFWFIMETFFADRLGLDYAERIDLLQKNKIALWDVLKFCMRKGSLDFASFFTTTPNIEKIFFNGATAEKEYLKRVLPVLSEKQQGIAHHRLPSTSPAMASLTQKEKLKCWKIVKLSVGSG